MMPAKNSAALRAISLTVLSALAAAQSANAQRLMVPHNRPHAQIALVDATVGALVDGAWIDVYKTAVPTPGNSQLLDVERVDDEVWIASPFYVYRYGARAPRPFIGSFRVDAPIRAIETQRLPGGESRVVITTTESLRLFTTDGDQYGLLPIAGGGDTLQLRDSMLVAIQDENRIDRYTLGGQRIGTFAGPSVPTSFGILSKPKQLARRPNGAILVAGDVRVYEFTESGAFMGQHDAGPFEGGVATSKTGRLVVPFGNGITLYDTLTRDSRPIDAGYFGEGRKVGRFDGGARILVQPGEGSSEEICRGAIHGGGIAARLGVAGSARVDDRALDAFIEHLPSTAFAALMLSTDPAGSFAAVPGLGTLCLDRNRLFVLPTVGQADSLGFATFELLSTTGQPAPIEAGSTWFAQSLYRDGAQMRLTSALRFTLPR